MPHRTRGGGAACAPVRGVATSRARGRREAPTQPAPARGWFTKCAILCDDGLWTRRVALRNPPPAARSPQRMSAREGEGDRETDATTAFLSIKTRIEVKF